ncbi:serine hydrolase domain-containing protein [Bacillus paralicheniformis]|uniref:serine hydrolase domain-containing protein n=1 Tax=Bacillus paralicheniformis TaxID=1648923 RepID=UPI0028682589|nr:serine hydrolase domain-containing protein [Bacillus paralicheniformis]WMW49333.1 serine hydrolase domain-containing protein [Bacillus paralicheniformis]
MKGLLLLVYTAEHLDDYLMEQASNNHFHGSILLADSNGILLSKGYGYANCKDKVKNKPSTRYQIASLTKQFTAIAVMQLQEKGLLRTDDPVQNYLEGYPNGDSITIKHLLSHTSGIPDFLEEELLDIELERAPLDQFIGRFIDKPLEFRPGQRFNYSNSGYILLTKIIETITNEAYGDVIQELIFDPLGMKNSGFFASPEDISPTVGYLCLNREMIKAPIVYGYGESGLYSTVEDLYLWDRALYTEKLVTNGALKEALYSCVKKPAFTAEGPSPALIQNNSIGYGWFINHQNKYKIWHDGEIHGFISSINRYINEKKLLIMLSNCNLSKTDEILANVEQALLQI